MLKGKLGLWKYYGLHAARLLLLLALFSLCSCSSGLPRSVEKEASTKPSGELSLRFPENLISERVFLIEVTLTRAGYQAINKTVTVSANLKKNPEVKVSEVPVGEWFLTIEAKDNRNEVRFRSRGNFRIVGGGRNSFFVEMKPSSQEHFEDVNLILGWPASEAWKMPLKNPVVSQTPGSWDHDHAYVTIPRVLKMDNEYVMWYVSGNSTIFLARATSKDGLQWNKDPAPLNTPLLPWCDGGTNGVWVSYDKGEYQMWFEGLSSSQSHSGLGYGVSKDGINWAYGADPILSPSTDAPGIMSPAVVKHGGLYYVYYAVEKEFRGMLTSSIWMATSVNGYELGNHQKMLEGMPDQRNEERGVSHPYVFRDGAKFIMFFNSVRSDGISISSAESRDGIHWSRAPRSNEFTSSFKDPWKTTMVGYPSLLLENGRLRMWFAGLVEGRWQIGYAEQDW